MYKYIIFDMNNEDDLIDEDEYGLLLVPNQTSSFVPLNHLLDRLFDDIEYTKLKSCGLININENGYLFSHGKLFSSLDTTANDPTLPNPPEPNLFKDSKFLKFTIEEGDLNLPETIYFGTTNSHKWKTVFETTNQNKASIPMVVYGVELSAEGIDDLLEDRDWPGVSEFEKEYQLPIEIGLLGAKGIAVTDANEAKTTLEFVTPLLKNQYYNLNPGLTTLLELRNEYINSYIQPALGH